MYVHLQNVRLIYIKYTVQHLQVLRLLSLSSQTVRMSLLAFRQPISDGRKRVQPWMAT